METFALDVGYQVGVRKSSAAGRVGGRAIELEIERPLIRGPRIIGTFGDDALSVSGSGRSGPRSFVGTWGSREVDLLVARDRRRFDIRGVVGEKSVRLRIRKRVLGPFVLAASHHGDGNQIRFDPSGLVDLTGRVVQPETGMAVAVLVEPMLKAWKSAFQ